ncbi:MAG: hypothetical protein ACREMY_21400, partial [bacterium]
VNSLSSVLMLASFDGTNWGSPIQITGNPFSSKSAPQLAITRDSFVAPDSSGNSVPHHRTIIHVVWKEQTATGNNDVLYTPVILEEGTYLGWAPVYDLTAMVGDSTPGSSFIPPTGLVQIPVLQAGRDTRTLLVGFASVELQTLSTVEVDVLPEEISLLAEDCRTHLIELGQTLYPNQLQALADKASVDLVAEGTAFHPDIIKYLASQIHDLILTNGGTDLTALTEDARTHLIELGSRLSGRGLRDSNPYDKALVESIVSVANQDSTTPANLIHFRVASSRPVPQMGSNGVQFFLSTTGDDAIVAWTDSGMVLYRQSQEMGWSVPRQIKLSSSLSLDQAYAILKQRARNR